MIERIKLKRSIFKNIISDKIKANLHKDIFKQDNNEFNYDSFNDYFSNICKLLNDLNKNTFNKQFDEFRFMYQDLEFRKMLLAYRYNSLENLKWNHQELDKHKVIWVMISVYFSDKEPFKLDIFNLNMNYLIISIIHRIDGWYDFFYNDIICYSEKQFNKLSKKNTDEFTSISEVNLVQYRIDCLLLEIYNAYDALSYHFYLISKNRLLTINYLNDLDGAVFFRLRMFDLRFSSKPSFRNLCRLINEIQADAKIKKKENFKKVATQLGLLECEKWDDIQWIVNQRDYVPSDFLSLEDDLPWLRKHRDTKKMLAKWDQNKKLNLIMLLFMNYVLLFYAILDALDCLE